MAIDLHALLALPAAERLALAAILRNSVGWPAEIDSPELPPWQLAQFERVLQRYAADGDG
ncbi:MAG: hypothetical protein ABI661_05640 [Gammaproteobacteria bacterium]